MLHTVSDYGLSAKVCITCQFCNYFCNKLLSRPLFRKKKAMKLSILLAMLGLAALTCSLRRQ